MISQAEKTVVLYAADSQDPEDVTSSRNLSLTHASTKYTSTPQNQTSGSTEETLSPDSPVLDLHELSSRDIMSSFMEAPETPTRPSSDLLAKPPAQKQYRLLTEFGANVSRIDENLLGFSLPDLPNKELVGYSPNKEMIDEFPEPVTPEPVSPDEEPASCASSSILPVIPASCFRFCSLSLDKWNVLSIILHPWSKIKICSLLKSGLLPGPYYELYQTCTWNNFKA